MIGGPGPEEVRTAVLPDESAEELYDDAPCGYLTTTADGTIVRVNGTFLRWTGRSSDDLVGRTRFRDLLTAGGRVFHETHYAPMLALHGSVREIALDVVRADGTTLPALVSAVRRPTAGGGPALVRTTVFDATHRREYELELLRARRAAEASEARMRALQEVVERLAAASSSADVVEVIASAAALALAARGSTVWLLDGLAGAEPSDLALVAWTGMVQPQVRRIEPTSTLPHRWCVTEAVVQVVEPVPDGAAAGPLEPVTTAPGTSRVALVPLVTGDRPVGVLAVELPSDREITPTTSSLMGTLGRQAGQALERARLADSAAEQARRSAFLLRAATVLAAATDFRDTLERLAAVAVPALADICLIDILTESGPVRMVGRHGDPARQPFVDEVVRDYSPTVSDDSPAVQALLGGEVVWQQHVDRAWLEAGTRDERHRQLAEAAGFDGFIAVPLITEDRVLGAITLATGPTRDPFTQADVELAQELGRQVALVAARAERFDVEYRASHALQAGLLPPLPPPVEGLAVGVRYLPASRWADVGGDFYDVLPLADGSVAFAVGDVVGHDLTAAATMGQLRSVYRALVAEGASPAEVIDRMQASWPVLGLERMATGVFGRLWPATGEVRLASAGHPPPLLVHGGRAELVPVRPTTMLGITLGPAPEWSGTVPPDATIVLYTDGLVEVRTERLDAGLERLRRTAADSGTHDPESLCDALLAELVAGHRGDDVALLAIGRPGAAR
ncbi:SpoIIE family protein phosphatase [uncultured Cellulomonas sp.]|uniref:SpoIIE family protein phosphatase n=1 Tax=uncultured Cellulomonas sp. TaxID=189682 RepID=UPI00263497C9|nr:SpoIIE family protein phosphatase [uncultured Cellulomonas sp.]